MVTIGVFSAGLPGVQHTEVTIVTLLLLSVLTDLRLILNLTELEVLGSWAWADCRCDTSPPWYGLMISLSHLLLTTNRSHLDTKLFIQKLTSL